MTSIDIVGVIDNPRFDKCIVTLSALAAGPAMNQERFRRF